jgi:hypothetical protein
VRPAGQGRPSSHGAAGRVAVYSRVNRPKPYRKGVGHQVPSRQSTVPGSADQGPSQSRGMRWAAQCTTIDSGAGVTRGSNAISI